MRRAWNSEHLADIVYARGVSEKNSLTRTRVNLCPSDAPWHQKK
jgi:hypothetical protein